MSEEPQKIITHNRLHKEQVEAGGECGRAILGESIRRQGDEPQGLTLQARFLETQPPHHLVSVKARHAFIEEGEVE